MKPRFKAAILTDISNAYSRQLLQGISYYIRDFGPWDIFYEERTLESPVPKNLKNWHGDGIIVRSLNEDLARAALKTGAKVVDVGINRLPELPTVFPDYDEDSKLIVQHFRERFYTNFAYVGIREKYYSTARLEAFRKYTAPDPVSILELEQEELKDCCFDANKTITEWLLKLPRPCAVMVCYDYVGLHVIQACRHAKLNVPNEIAVAGVNDDEIQCLLSPVPLTSVACNPFKIGFRAARLLHLLMLGKKVPATEFIPPLHLTVRQSTNACVIPDPIVRQAFLFIHENACKGISVQQTANYIGVNRRKLERHFKNAMKKTVHEEIIQVQLTAAAQLIERSDLSMDAVARKVGFSDGAYLSTLYKKAYGASPRYKKKNSSSVKEDFTHQNADPTPSNGD